MNAAREADRDEETVVVECELDAAPEKIWRALTVPELASAWLGVEGSEAEEADGGHSYAIIETEPFARVRYAWSEVGLPDSIVTVDLAPRPQGRTWFRLTHGPVAGATVLMAANGNAPPLACAA